MIERILLLAGIILLLVTLLSLFRRQQLKQARSAASVVGNTSISGGKLRVVYFWSAQCSQCAAVQTPVIDNLVRMVGKETLAVSKFNVSESLELAKDWGVKTVPTTYVLDKNGIVQHVNNGLVAEKHLAEQIEGLRMLNCNT